MDSTLKFINKWLIIFMAMLILFFVVNKFTSWRYETKGDFVIDTLTNDVLHVDTNGKVSRVR